MSDPRQDIYFRIADATPSAVVVLDDRGKTVFANATAKLLFGEKQLEQPLQLDFETPLPEVFVKSTGALMSAGQHAKVGYYTREDGRRRICSVIEESGDGLRILFVSDITDATEYWEKLHRHKSAEDLLYRSQMSQEGRLDSAIREIIELASVTMQVERMNIWRIDENFRSISSIGNYDAKEGMLPNVTLQRQSMPDYFRLLESAEIVVTADSAADPQTAELRDGYIIPNGIISMMDVPIRIEGRMVGVVCFEETKNRREWDIAEQKFGLSVAQIIALTLESHERRKTQKSLEAALSEKQLLLREVNHRVKNNFELIGDILKVHAAATRDDYHRELFNDCLARLNSISLAHRLLYQGDSLTRVNFRDFLLDLCGSYRPLFSGDGIQLITLLDPIILPMAKAVCAGLIVNELLSNAAKHAFVKKENNTITIKLQQFGSKARLEVSDNGKIADLSGEKKNQAGLSLVNELVERLNGQLEHEVNNGNQFTLRFAPN